MGPAEVEHGRRPRQAGGTDTGVALWYLQGEGPRAFPGVRELGECGEVPRVPYPIASGHWSGESVYLHGQSLRTHLGEGEGYDEAAWLSVGIQRALLAEIQSHRVRVLIFQGELQSSQSKEACRADTDHP